MTRGATLIVHSSLRYRTDPPGSSSGGSGVETRRTSIGLHHPPIL
jgi:hypothetical protein